MIHLLALSPVLAENSLFKAVGEIFHPLFELVGTILAFIYGLIPNYAIAIILLTILIMALLTPLTIKSTKSMIAMQALQPELQKLRQKYKGAENREQLNSEMMRLYKEHGVSPTGGCLPMFLQMPALIVLYDTIKGLTNTINKKALFPTTAVLPLKNAMAATGKTASAFAHRGAGNGLVYVGPHHGSSFHALTCLPSAGTVCAVPRYIPTTSTMFHNLVNTPGVMKSFGLNLASKPLTHHAHWYDYIPYFALVAIAVALQYFQMSQMTKRNKNAAQMNPQMQTMQKVMPLIFAYIYFLVPAGVVIYMIVSSAIRIGTQDFIFRYGIVKRPGEREIGGSGKKKPGAGGAPALDVGSEVLSGEKTAGSKAGGARPKSGGTKAGGPGSTGGAGSKTGQRSGSRATGAGAGTNGKTNGKSSGANGTSQGGADSTPPKAHPRSKSKRTRKAR
jgi:YidC/Oxa1 family membrane protein insertase